MVYLFIYLYNFAFICLINTNYHAQTILHTVNMAGNPQQRHRPITAAPVFYPLPQFLTRRLQKVQFATASFVLGRYVNDQKDILEIGWLPVNERRDLDILKSSFPAWPEYLKLERQTCRRELRSTNAIRLAALKILEHSKITLPNFLFLYLRIPGTVLITSNKQFIKLTKKFLFERAH